MATRALFRCDGAQPSRDLGRGPWDVEHVLRSEGPSRNVQLGGVNENGIIARAITGRGNDLARLAAFAYAADQAVSRGGLRDIHDELWRREMILCVPVSDPTFWNEETVTEALRRVLGFATDDRWLFSFTRASGPRQLPLSPGDESNVGPTRAPDHVALLSGGADSLCAVVDALRQGRRPLIVSHRPSPAHSARQRNLSHRLGHKYGLWPLASTRFPIHLIGWQAKESTQRSRAFLYASLGAALAYEAKLKEVILADNGVVSINLPLNASVRGAMASRSTHPRFLELFNELAALVLPGVRVANPLLSLTRAEALTVLVDEGHADLLTLTNSCSRVHHQKPGAPHCGFCSQCVDRRFGTIRAGLEGDDPPDKYEVDIFTRHLQEGDERTVPMSYVDRARRIESLNDDALFSEYTQLADCIPDHPVLADRMARELIALLRRHADDVREVMRVMMDRHWRGLWLSDVAEYSLLRLVSGTVTLPAARPGAEASEQAANGDPTTVARASADNVFRRQGDGWRVVYAGQEAHVRHSEGMRYIAYLLAKPNEDTSAAALRNRFGAGASAAVVVTMGAHQAESEGLAESRADRYDLIDDTTRRQLEARLAEIELDRIQARERHDRRAVRALSDEAMRLSQYLKEASGLAGQTRHFGSEEERVAEAVRTAIRRARERIREHHLELANHLKVTIRGGLHISYTPGSPMLWDAEP